MRNILLVKTSSMGDVVHNLPVVADIRAAWPDAGIDWVVESAFAAIPRMHPDVRRVIESDVRTWRKAPFASGTWASIRRFRRELRSAQYDVVIDAQGLLKSALLSRSAIAPRYAGLDRQSAREPVASFLYTDRIDVAKRLHAVARCRELVASALSIPLRGVLDYGIALCGPTESVTADVVLLHATSRAEKCWPIEDWIALGHTLNKRGLRCVLPSGSGAERARSEHIASNLANAWVPPAMTLDDLAALFARARAVVGVDTGLAHLATALGRPTVALFVASDPKLTGVYGSAVAINLGGLAAPPSVAEVTVTLERLRAC